MNDDLARTLDKALALGLDWIRNGESIIATGAYRDASADELAAARSALRAEAPSAFPVPPVVEIVAPAPDPVVATLPDLADSPPPPDAPAPEADH